MPSGTSNSSGQSSIDGSNEAVNHHHRHHHHHHSSSSQAHYGKLIIINVNYLNYSKHIVVNLTQLYDYFIYICGL